MEELFSGEIIDALLLLIRLTVGSVMLYYGVPKITDLKANARDFKKMGFKNGMFFGTIVALLETVGGLGIILGVCVWLVAVLFGFEMIMGALWKSVKAKRPFSDWSYDLLLLNLCLVLLLFGPGIFTLFYFLN